MFDIANGFWGGKRVGFAGLAEPERKERLEFTRMSYAACNDHLMMWLGLITCISQQGCNEDGMCTCENVHTCVA